MPLFSFGQMRCMHKWQDMALGEIPKSSQQNIERLVERAFEKGINHFETARAYGSSERQLGQALAGQQRDSFIMQTKVRPRDNVDDFVAEFTDSLNRLGLQRVDLLSIHGINDHQSFWQACRSGGCLAAARGLQAQGKVGHIGFSGHADTPLILEAVRHQQDGGFDYLNLHWYYIFQSNWPAIAEAHQRGMGVLLISATDKGGMLQQPPSKLVELCKPFSPMLFNDAFCLSHPEVNTISVGASEPWHFDEHLKALELLEEGGEILTTIDSRLQKAMQEACGHQRPDWLWSQLPAWKDTPGHINLKMILWLYNLAMGWDLVEYGKGRYNKLGNQMPWVPGCNASQAGFYDFQPLLPKLSLTEKELKKILQETHNLLTLATA